MLTKLFQYNPSTSVSYLNEDLDQVYTALSGVTDGLAGGGTVTGGIAAAEDLTLRSTAHATKGHIFIGSLSAFSEADNFLGIGTAAPEYPLHALGGSSGATRPAVLFGTFTDTATAGTPASRHVLRARYVRDAAATVSPTDGADSLAVFAPVIQSNAAFALYGAQFTGPQVSSGRTLTTYAALRITAPSGSGAVTNKYAALVDDAAGSVGLGTLSPVSKLHVAGTGAVSSRVQCSDGGGFTLLMTANTSGANIGASDVADALVFGSGAAANSIVVRGGYVGFFGSTTTNGSKVLFLSNCSVVPTTNPVGGIQIYVEGNVLKYRKPDGSVVVPA